MSEIDRSDQAIKACEFWQRIGAGAKNGRPVGTINGAPIYEVDELPPETQPMFLFVPPVHFSKGEAWIRETYAVGPDVVIRETLPLP